MLDRNEEAAHLLRSTSRIRDEQDTRLPIVGLRDEQIAAVLLEGKPVYVALRLDDRRYGGPEEGGWYYDCQTIEYQAPARSAEGVHALVTEFRRHRSNEDRYGTGSARSRGVYVVSIDSQEQVDEPEERPRYQ
jgi:hypothetical protein